MRKLNGIPLLAYSTNCSKKSDLINKTFIVTDSQEYESIALDYGAESIGIRPEYTATDISTDFDWIKWFIDTYQDIDENDLIYILRPTNPFRNTA